MRLHVEERKFYKPIMDPPGLIYEMSIDRGLMWFSPDAVTDGQPAFLLKGAAFIPDQVDDTAGQIVSTTVRPLIRCRDNPEVLITSAPYVIVWG